MIEETSSGAESSLPVDAVVVNFNAGRSLTDAVRALSESRVRRVVIVDNASTDDSLDRFAAADLRAEVVRERVNLGYGTAANRGVAACDSAFVLVMNPDVNVAPDALEILVSTLDRSDDVGAVGPRIVDVSGATYPSARRFPSFGVGAAHALIGLFWPHNQWSQSYRAEVRGDAQLGERDADWVSGACVLIRKVAFDSVGGFDEGYFMYVEDLDLCWRIHRAGWRIRYEPEAVATHVQGLSTRTEPYKMLIAHHRSTWRFATKTMTGTRRPLLALVGVGLLARALVALAKLALEEGLRRGR
ncbi:MAG: glycosyltransferase family 2 protein [Acidimicrobiales bacterium]